MNHIGTWFHRRYKQWYDLDGLFLKKHGRLVSNDITTIAEDFLLDYGPKQITLSIKKTKVITGHYRSPKTNTDRLNDENIKKGVHQKNKRTN